MLAYGVQSLPVTVGRAMKVRAGQDVCVGSGMCVLCLAEPAPDPTRSRRVRGGRAMPGLALQVDR
jgi:hypothetical protein